MNIQEEVMLKMLENVLSNKELPTRKESDNLKVEDDVINLINKFNDIIISIHNSISNSDALSSIGDSYLKYLVDVVGKELKELTNKMIFTFKENSVIKADDVFLILLTNFETVFGCIRSEYMKALISDKELLKFKSKL